MNQLIERGKIINEQGYVLIYVPEHPNANNQGYVLEHRYLVEIQIGRLLKQEEPVHHINGIRTDNSIWNLMPFHSQKEHKSFENKVKRYGLTNPIVKKINERWDKFR